MALLVVMASTGSAATCGAASSGGSAPSDWQTFCWVDMSSYNNATVFAGGQPISITLSDGSVFSFTLSGNSPNGSSLAAIAPPSWTGAAVGNTAFLGIPGKPILYTNAPGTVNLTLSNIKITPPNGITGGGAFKVVIADAESSNDGESLTYTTNGGAWTMIDQVPPTTGALYPGQSGAGTTTFTETGVAGTVGAFIVGTQTPSTVNVQIVAGGLQGIMFAVQYATVSANKVITGARANAADQFTYGVKSTTTGTVLGSRSTSGTGLTGFTPTVSTVSSAVPVTVYEQMAAGSVSTLGQYTTNMNCTNGTAGSPTVLPSNQAVTSYNIGAVAYGDAIACTFTNTPIPATVSLQLITVGATGGTFAFSATNLTAAPASITTAVAGTATPAAPTAINVTAINTQVQVTQSYSIPFTTTSATCTDANSAVTGNPASFGTLAGNVLTIPAANILAGAKINCIFTDTGAAPTLSLQKAMAGTGRLAAADQFKLAVTGTGAPAAVNTTGTGTAITSAPINFTATAGAAYVMNETMATGSVSLLPAYIQSAACTNANVAGTVVSGLTTLPISITPSKGDAISCIITNNGTPTPKLSITKSYTTAPTPVKVGQVITYSYAVTNTGNVPITNVQVKDMHGAPAVQVPLGAGGITSETLTTAGPYGAAASTDATPNNGIWSTLAPGATVTFTWAHTVTQAEIDHG